jgi:hypothetical protein
MDGRFRTPWAFFVDRVRTNVHVVLSFDPKNPKFGMRCESNPAIYNKCTILWMGRWSKYGMLQVGASFSTYPSLLFCSTLPFSAPLYS